MNAKLRLGLCALVVASACVGCGPNMGIVRGQNPADGSIQQVGFHRHHNSYDYCDPNCPDSSCHDPHCLSKLHHSPIAGHPHHYNTYSYKTPDDLVYPPAAQMPAVIQYPYYTHRGPTDFFMK